MKKNRPTEFNLKTVKRADNGGLIVKCHSRTEEEEGTVNDKDDKESDRVPHNDLLKIMNNIAWVVADVFGIKKLLPDADQKKVVAWNKNVKVNAVHLSGDAENPGCIISTTVTTRNGQKAAVNTPRIALKGDSYGFEVTLEEAVNDLKEEVLAYFYDGKGSTINMFNQGEDKGEGKPAKKKAGRPKKDAAKEEAKA